MTIVSDLCAMSGIPNEQNTSISEIGRFHPQAKVWGRT
jgi:hypothetical protein